jgi:hypothetical protein
MTAFALVYNPPANLTDYTSFLRAVGFDATVLPDASPYIPNSLQIALDIVNQTLAAAAPNEAVLATYNLGADILVNSCPDQAPALTGLTWAAGVATATAAAVLPSSWVAGNAYQTTVAGATPLGYNGTVQATPTSGNTFTYPLAADPGMETVPGTYTTGFFAALRKQWNILAPVTGVVAESHDESTGTSVLNPEQMKEFTMANLQQMKTPYGRAYIAFAQSYGQTLWGLT